MGLSEQLREATQSSAGDRLEEGVSYNVTLRRVSEDQWVAEFSGKGSEHLKSAQKKVTAEHGWKALAALAEKWKRAGFAD